MSRRMEQINTLLQQELSKIIQAEGLIYDENELGKRRQNYIVTVQEVQAAKDLKTAKVWVSIFGVDLTDEIKEEIIAKLQEKTAEFQKQLSRLELKFTPKLTFKLDTSGEVGQKIDEIIQHLK